WHRDPRSLGLRHAPGGCGEPGALRDDRGRHQRPPPADRRRSRPGGRRAPADGGAGLESTLDRAWPGGLPEELHARGRDRAHARPLPPYPRGACAGPNIGRGNRGASMSEPVQASGSGIVTAALMVIGDEILSGRTKDQNIGYIADHLTAIGIQLKEVRVIPDDE